MEADTVDAGQWEEWSRLLSRSPAAPLNAASSRPSEALGQLYSLAVELRDKLRYSQTRLKAVKYEYAACQAARERERHDALARLSLVESELARLAGAVSHQAGALAAREAAAQHLTAENAVLRREVAELRAALGDAAAERDDALTRLDEVAGMAEEAHAAASEQEEKAGAFLGELLSTKDRLAGLAGLEGLYRAARDELSRLDKENMELKDMFSAGHMELGTSRILGAMGGVPQEGDVFVPLAGGSGRTRRSKSAGRLRSPGSKKQSAALALLGPSTYGRGAWLPEPVPKAADFYRTNKTARALRSANTSPSPALSKLLGPSVSEPPDAAGMAWLGPPSMAYPPDPEAYSFYRTGGGYTAMQDPANPTIPQPRCSGWVPKDVVRLVQAFRHSYSLSLEWRYWEPLVLMIDEVYRSHAEGALSGIRGSHREKLKNMRRQLTAALTTPSVVANQRADFLARQLAATRKTLAVGDATAHSGLVRMAAKDYALGAQLDRALEENSMLRQSLQQLEVVYSSERGDKEDGSASEESMRRGDRSDSMRTPTRRHNKVAR